MPEPIPVFSVSSMVPSLVIAPDSSNIELLLTIRTNPLLCSPARPLVVPDPVSITLVSIVCKLPPVIVHPPRRTVPPSATTRPAPLCVMVVVRSR